MPKPTVTAVSRANEFKTDSFYVNDGKILMCKFCDTRIDFERKDSVLKHISSARHKTSKLKAANVQRQLSLAASLNQSKKAREDKEEFIVNTTEAFIAAGMSVEKLDHPKIREWLALYVKGSGDLPHSDQLRKKYIPLVGEKKVIEIKEKIKGKDISIMSDETTDKGGNCVFNVLFRLVEAAANQEVFLAASNVLDAANGRTCAQSVLETLAKYEVDYDNCLTFVTDSARYMTSCFKTLEGLIGPHLIHTQCWAHKLNLVGQMWQNGLDELNIVVAKVKGVFLNTRKRKHRYLDFLREKYGLQSQKVKLFPMPVQTRWNSWFQSVFYIDEYLEDIIAFLEDFSEENAGVKFLKEMSNDELAFVQIQARFVSDNGHKLVDLIQYLEGNTYPTAHILYTKIDDLASNLALLSNCMFSMELNEMLKKLTAKKEAIALEKLRLVSQSSETKLKNLKMLDPSNAAFSACNQLFNPRNISRLTIEETYIQPIVKNMIGLQKPDINTWIEGLTILKKIVIEEQGKPNVNQIDVCQLLCTLKSSHALFASFALKSIWMPTSNVDCERSFSRHSIIVSDRRRSLIPENAETLTMVAF